jgi:glycosyltransferase involved in cell wall biosynthesis
MKSRGSFQRLVKIMKAMVLHDYFESLEGGGRLSSILAERLPADLGYGFAKTGHPFLTSRSSGQHDLHAFSRLPLWRQFKLSLAFTYHTDFLKDYETVIYSGFYSPLAVRHHPQGRNILYCHTPPRFIYDQRDFYLSSLPIWLRPALQAFIDYLQPRYEDAVAQMDTIVANSKNVRRRIQHYLGREAVVVYPPCETMRFSWQGDGDYYLSMGRLDPLKRVDLIVEAFLKMPEKRLVVTSGGAELHRLQRLAEHARNIQFTGWLDDVELAKLIGNAIATVYLPKDEDLGMSPLESMAAGKPVIGVAEGGLLETVIPEETGVLLKPPLSLSAICEAVESMTPLRALSMRVACEKQAQRFRTEVFLENMGALIEDVVE